MFLNKQKDRRTLDTKRCRTPARTKETQSDVRFRDTTATVTPSPWYFNMAASGKLYQSPSIRNHLVVSYVSYVSIEANAFVRHSIQKIQNNSAYSKKITSESVVVIKTL